MARQRPATPRPLVRSQASPLLSNAARKLRSSPVQTFVLYPALVVGTELLRRRGRLRVNRAAVPLMVAGVLLYQRAGSYRRARAGGRGMRAMPAVLVTSGPYALTRNPMYAGHLLFTAGLAIATCSPLAALLLAERWIRFERRIRIDERRLAQRFGAHFDAYRERVPRWLPRPAFPLAATPGAGA